MYHEIGLEELLACAELAGFLFQRGGFTGFDAADACAAAKVKGDQICCQGDLLQVGGDGVEDEGVGYAVEAVFAELVVFGDFGVDGVGGDVSWDCGVEG